MTFHSQYTCFWWFPVRVITGGSGTEYQKTRPITLKCLPWVIVIVKLNVRTYFDIDYQDPLLRSIQQRFQLVLIWIGINEVNITTEHCIKLWVLPSLSTPVINHLGVNSHSAVRVVGLPGPVTTGEVTWAHPGPQDRCNPLAGWWQSHPVQTTWCTCRYRRPDCAVPKVTHHTLLTGDSTLTRQTVGKVYGRVTLTLLWNRILKCYPKGWNCTDKLFYDLKVHVQWATRW